MCTHAFPEAQLLTLLHYFHSTAEAQGRPCELDGRVYQHGEDFQPSCEHHCTCMDGVVGCMPLCPHHVSLPDWRCARSRLTKLPGRCCQEWVCDDDNHIAEDDTMLESTPHEYEKHNDITSNELLVMAPTPWDSSAGAPYRGRWMARGLLQQPHTACRPDFPFVHL